MPNIVMQEVPDGNKDSPGGLWQFIGLLPLFDPPRHDSADTIRRALDLGVSVKMITGICCAIHPLLSVLVKVHTCAQVMMILSNSCK